MPRAVVLPAARLSAGPKLEIQMFHPRIQNIQPPLVYIHPSITHKHCLEMAVTPNPQHVVPPGGHKNPRKAMSCSPVPQMCGGSVGSRAGGPGPCLYLP